VGFEPTNGGFADLSLGPLGYRAETLSIAESHASVRASRAIENSKNSISSLLVRVPQSSLPAKNAPTLLVEWD
jgi:hypothetical protein